MVEVKVLLERSRLLLAQGRYHDAEIIVKQALESDPRNEEGLAILSRCYMDSKRMDAGIETAVKALSINPLNSYYFYLLGYGHYHKSRHDAASYNLGRAIQLNPYHPEYFGLLAYVLLDQREFERALETADEGLALDAENITCLNARSVALNKLKRTKDAIEALQGALARDPENEMTHVTAGWNYLEKGNQKQATHHFLEALRINPNHSNAKTGLKEALKSNIAPYRWLLQYSFWVNTKATRWRRAMPIAFFIIFRVIIIALNQTYATNDLVMLVAGFYVFCLILSWTINPIANFFLLFHRIGKHALTPSEKWTSITVVASLLAGFSLLLTSVIIGSSDSLIVSGIVLVSFSLPLCRMQYPLSTFKKDWREWYRIGLLAAGIVTLVLATCASSVMYVPFSIYMLALVVYSWLGAFGR